MSEASSQLPSHRLKQAKRALRREILERRDALPADERAGKSLAIADRLLALPELAAARTVMAFWSFGSEVATPPLLERLHARGVQLALPRIEGNEVVAAWYRPDELMSETPFGAMEPAEAEALPPDALDVVVVPGIAFDRQGNRVWYGGGFYDRLSLRLRPDAFAVAIAFALQLVDAAPSGGADRRVAAIVTEGEVIRCR